MFAGVDFSAGRITKSKAREIAKKMFDEYDKDKSGYIEYQEVPAILKNIYKGIKKNYEPTESEVKSFLKVLDENNDGKITVVDLELLAIKYLDAIDDPIIDVKKEAEKQKIRILIQQHLDVARRLFKQFDEDNSGYITEEEAGPLIRETYKQMQIHYSPSEEDVKIWMEMADLDHDKKVSLPEYEDLIIRSLEKIGIKLE